MFQYRHVLVRMRQGDSDRDIKRAKLMGRRKAAELRQVAEERGWLQAESELPDDGTIAGALGAARRAASTISSAEPHRTIIEEWIARDVKGVAIHAALKRDYGYKGSYSSVYRMLVAIRAARPPEATVRLAFAPAEAAQVDFGAGPELFDATTGRTRRTWCFVMTLAFSRHQYVEFVWDQTVATWLGCHRRAFEWFGAVPGRVIIDNPKCAITKACSRDPLVQRAYAECAEGYGFKIDPCPPADPQKKGIVEAGVKYVKGNFMPTRSFRDLADLNAQARAWVMEEAGVRIHGTTRERPLEQFALEKPLMKALPAIAPDLGTWSRVTLHRDCHVQHERIHYSAPFTLVGKRLWLRATDNAVTIYEDYRLVATHPRGRKPGQRFTVRDHLPPDAQAFFARDRNWCLKQAATVGPACAELVEQLLTDRVLERLRAAQGVIGLGEKYGAARLEAACSRALNHGTFHYRHVKEILSRGFDEQPQLVVADTSGAYARTTRFTRNALTLFTPKSKPH
jgi:transposase